MKKLILIFVLAISFLSAKSQLENLQFTNQTKVEIDPSLKKEIDSIFPNISFIVKQVSHAPRTWLFAINDNDTTLIKHFNFRDLQLQSSLLKDSLLRYSNNAVIYSFVMFDLIKRQGPKFRISKFVLKKKEVTINHTYKIATEEEKYKSMDSYMRFINTVVTVTPDTAIFIFSGGRFNKVKKIEYELQVIDKIVCGVVPTFYTVDGQIHTDNYRRLNAYDLNYELNRYRKIREAAGNDNSSYVPSSHNIGLAEPSNLEYQNTPLTGTTSINIVIEDKGMN